MTKHLEIDETNGGPGDANVLLESPIYKNPVTDPNNPPPDAAWVDWSDLNVDNHRLQDLNDPNDDRDYSSFPRSNECVASSKVLSKMDLTYVGVANNADFAYFAVQRSNNNGDAGYYWLMTHKKPSQTLGEAPCKAGERRLVYDITKGDVLLSGHFQPSATPLLEAYVAIADRNGVDAVSAINFTDTTLWQQNNAAIVSVAVNQTNIDPGTWGVEGVDKQALSGGQLEPELFAEAAVLTSLFTGGSICGAKFFGSVITRSSGSGGTTPDLKDLAGPREFNFGDVTPSASLSSSCQPEITFSASLKGLNGEDIANPTCTWQLLDGGGSPVSAPADCSTTIAAAPGSYTATVTITDPGTGCGGEVTDLSVEVYSEPTATATLTPTCESKFGYDVTPGGGKSPYSYAWEFSNASSVVGTSTLKSAYLAVAPDVDYTGDVVVTDARGCTATASDTAHPFAPIGVVLSVADVAQTCSENSDAATFLATASGGDGQYTYLWSTVGTPSCSPGTGATCTLDPSNDDLCTDAMVMVTVSDTSGLCAPKASPQGTYTKQTTISASVQ